MISSMFAFLVLFALSEEVSSATKNSILKQQNAELLTQIERAVGNKGSLAKNNRILKQQNVELMSQIEGAVGNFEKTESAVRNEVSLAKENKILKQEPQTAECRVDV